ncbi:hypothetical protein [Tessaracoccus aquimaris]|uniref:hypothetical protein n=1 Tax=Tessaracoccus aquimaris TaxID=1332264 RepID=UPI000988E664|nr:hypothetical protein [Tessaracoccus aquimaris]
MIAQGLLSGPRGRRFLLGFAQGSEWAKTAGRGELPLRRAVFHTSYRIEVGRGRSISVLSSEPYQGPRYDVADVVAALPGVPLAEPTDDLLVDALKGSVDAAMYWQEPDGDDLLCAIPAVRDGLARVADHLAGAPLLERWAGPMDPADQRSLVWEAQRYRQGTVDLRRWRSDALSSERRALKDRPARADANVSGNWWSCPPHELRRSTGSASDGLPLGVHLIEDALGWTEADATRLRIDPKARVLEIASADDWARLCRDHPLDVTASRRHDWYRATGRDGAWVVPDWCAVAERYDGVHLTIACYLEAATTAIPVDGDRASVIAGCDPDSTWWLNDSVVTPEGIERLRIEGD